jgi:AcrR family transcriptional regulator
MNGIVPHVYDFVSVVAELLPHPTDARAAVAASQRDRLLRAMADAAAEKGYANTVVSDVVARAGVSRKTFYEQFPGGKAECFLASYDAGVSGLIDLLGEHIGGARPVREQIDTMLGAYLDALAAEPAWAKTYLVEVFAIGRAAAHRRQAGLERFADAIRALHEQLAAEEGPKKIRPVDAVDHEAIVGGIAMMVTMETASGRAERLHELHDRVARFLFTSLERT